jgi:uncharacterized membrane protein
VQAQGRIAVLDLARGVALVAMASFHLTFDLEFFGFLPAGTTTTGFFWVYARAIAATFFFLAGVSLWLGHGGGIRWRAFGRRLAMILGGAALVSAATYAADPSTFVFFGILHSIAAASVAGLLFLRLPAAVTLAAALAAYAAPQFLRTGAFDTPWLAWLGLTTYGIRSVDFEPFLPWVAPLLAGIATAKIAARSGLFAALRRHPPSGAIARALGWAGRHSLAVYLVHQPVLMALVWAFTRIVGAG